MATEVTKIVDPGEGAGHDYHSLSLWEAGEQGDLTGVRDEIAVAKCRATGGTADTAAVTITGWTTSTTQYIKIWTDPTEGYRHNGKWDDTKYRLVVTGAVHAIGSGTGNEQHIRIDGLQISSSDSQYRVGIQHQSAITNSPELRVSNCIIKTSGTATEKYGIQTTEGIVLKAWNNIIYDYSTAGSVGISSREDITGPLYYNNTIINCTTGLRVLGWADGRVVNNLVKGGTTAFDGYVAYAHNNSTDNATGPDGVDLGSNRISQTFTFADEANDDFHLASTDAGARNYGTDLSADGNLAFTTDIDGQTRPGENVWDIGADEYVAAGGLSIPVDERGMNRGMNRGTNRGMSRI